MYSLIPKIPLTWNGDLNDNWEMHLSSTHGPFFYVKLYIYASLAVNWTTIIHHNIERLLLVGVVRLMHIHIKFNSQIKYLCPHGHISGL